MSFENIIESKTVKLPSQWTVDLPAGEQVSSQDLVEKTNEVAFEISIQLKEDDTEREVVTSPIRKRKYFSKRRPSMSQLLQMCHKKLAQDPQSIKALLIQASILIKTGQFDKAITSCTKIMEIDKEEENAYNYRAKAYQGLHKLDFAIRDFSTVLSLNPNHVNAAYSRAACQNMKGNYDEAIVDYELAFEKDLKVGSGRNRFLKSPDGKRKLVRAESLGPANKAQEIIRDILSKRSSRFSSDQNTEGEHESSTTFNIQQSDRNKQEKENEEVNHAIMEKIEEDIQIMGTPMSSMQRSDVTLKSSVSGEGEGEEPPSVALQAVPPTSSSRERRRRKKGKKQTQAYNLYEKGYKLRQKGQFAKAIEFYRKAIALNPKLFKAHFNLAFALDKVKQYNEAIKHYTEAIEIEPNNAYAYYNRGIALDRQGTSESLQLAVADFSNAIELDPLNANNYMNRGVTLKKLNRLDEAIENYSKAIDLSPKSFRALYNRGVAFELKRNYKSAYDDFGKAAKLVKGNSGRISVLYNRGIVAEKLERLPQAIQDFTEALKLNKKSGNKNVQIALLTSKGLVLERLKRFDEAVRDFTAAIEVVKSGSPERTKDSLNELLTNRGTAYRNLKKFSHAIRDFSAVLEFNSRNITVLTERGLAYRKQNNHHDAIRDFGSALKIDGTNIRARTNRAFSLAKCRKYVEAIHDYTQILKMDDSNVHALYNRAVSFDKLGRYKEAIRDFDRVLVLDPKNANAYFNRGSAYDSTGETELAVVDYSKALELDLKIEKRKR